MSDAVTDPFREARLPKWTQELLWTLRATIKAQEDELAAIREAHGALQNKGWFILPGINLGKDHPQVTLYFLTDNKANSLCTIGPDDVLLVGRTRKEWNHEDTKRRYELAAGRPEASGKKADKPL
jgi:hypothetical protein